MNQPQAIISPYQEPELESWVVVGMYITIALLALLPFFLSFAFLIWLASAAFAEPICSGTTGMVPYATQGTVINLNSIPLTPGHWDCTVAAEVQARGATVDALLVSLSGSASSLNSNNMPYTATSGMNGGPGYGMSVSTPAIRIDLTQPMTYYVNALMYFQGGTVQVRSYYHCTAITVTN